MAPLDGTEPLRLWLRFVGFQVGFLYLALEALRPPRFSKGA